MTSGTEIILGKLGAIQCRISAWPFSKDCSGVMKMSWRVKTPIRQLRTDEERKTSLEKMLATELLKLAMKTDEERKARLKKMVATTQLRLAPETEDERRARLEYLSDNPIYKPNNLSASEASHSLWCSMINRAIYIYICTTSRHL